MEKVKKHADVLSINIENSRFLSRLPVNDQEQQLDQQRQNQNTLDPNSKIQNPISVRNKSDGFVKSLKTSFDVIPAKAGIQCFQIVMDACLRRACPCGGRGMTEFHTFYEFVKSGINYYE